MTNYEQLIECLKAMGAEFLTGYNGPFNVIQVKMDRGWPNEWFVFDKSDGKFVRYGMFE